MKTNDYSYRRVHRYASCSAGALYSGCGALMCNIQMSTLVKTFWTLLNSSNFPECCQCRFISVFAVSTEVVHTVLAFLQLCHAVQHKSAIEASVGTESVNNDDKNKTVRRSHQ
jgi:uncharacterized membrane protein